MLVIASGVILMALMVLCCTIGWRKYLLSCAILVRGDAEFKRNPIFWFTSAREFCSLRWALTLFAALLAVAVLVLVYLSGLLERYSMPFLAMGAVRFVGIISILAYLGVTNGAAVHLCFWQRKLSRGELNDGVYVMIFQDQDGDALAKQRRLAWGWQYRYWREMLTFEGTLEQLIDRLYYLQERRVILEDQIRKIEQTLQSLEAALSKKTLQPVPNLYGPIEQSQILANKDVANEYDWTSTSKQIMQERLLRVQRNLELVCKEISFKCKVVKSIYALFGGMTAESTA